MQSADRLILGGFNEGNWPPRPEVDPWTNAAMRRTAGLQPHNWRTGLSAHDVWMASCAPEVIITHALRDSDAVTTPSRWRQRFDAVAEALSITAAVDRGQRWRDQLTALLPAPPMAPLPRPCPTPPVDARPRSFSATEIDDWIADPYSIYAKRVLELRPKDDLDRPIDAALRGNLVHDSLAAFLRAFPEGPLLDNALADLRSLARACLTRTGSTQPSAISGGPPSRPSRHGSSRPRPAAAPASRQAMPKSRAALIWPHQPVT